MADGIGASQKLTSRETCATSTNRGSRDGRQTETRVEKNFVNITGVGPRSGGPKKALILGDSHANHLRPLAAYIGKKYRINFTFYTAHGCPPVFGAYKIYGINKTATGHKREAGCRKQTERWRSLIQEKKFDYVGLAARWTALYEDNKYGPYTVRRDFLVTDDTIVLDAETSRQTFIRQLRITIDEIRATGAQVLLFSQVPNQGKNIRGCSAVPSYVISAASIDIRCGGIRKKLALERIAFTDHFFERLAERPGVDAVIPSRIFCPEDLDHCLSVVGRTSLYFDNDHINEYGALLYAKKWEASPEFPFVRNSGN